MLLFILFEGSSMMCNRYASLQQDNAFFEYIHQLWIVVSEVECRVALVTLEFKDSGYIFHQLSCPSREERRSAQPPHQLLILRAEVGHYVLHKAGPVKLE
jgi:hypothetical protein